MKKESSDNASSSNKFKSNIGVKLSSTELNIYEGLKSIGEEISTFYLDAIKLLHSDEFESRSYLISHLLREIDGGLRDVLLPLSNESEKCPACGQNIRKITHFEEICLILGAKSDEALPIRWKKISSEFHKLAHRYGAWKKPRNIEEIKKLWDEFESILYILIGNHINLLNQMDRMISREKPVEKFLNLLPNLLKDKSLNYYFFKELKYPDWFLPLRQIGFFTSIQVYKESTSIIYYLIRIAKENATKEQKKITEELLKIVEMCIEYRVNEIKEENPYMVDTAVLELCTYLPINKIPKSVLQLIELSIKVDPDFGLVMMSVSSTFIPYLLKNKNGVLFKGILKIILDYKIKDKTFSDYKPKINESQLYEILRKYKSAIIEQYPIITFNVALDFINQILKESPDYFSFWQIPTIEDSSQIILPDRYQVQLIQLFRDVLLKIDFNKCEGFVVEWVENEHTIFRRLAFYLINKRYKAHNLIFWKIEKNPLNDSDCSHELYELFKECSKEFSIENIEKILKWIETADYYVSDSKGQKENEESVAYMKREWLSSIKETKNPSVIKRNAEYEKINSIPLSHPGHIIWHESSFGFKSPINFSKIEDLTVEKLVKELKNIKFQSDSEALDNRGLNIQLTYYIKNNSLKVSEEIKLFLDLNISYCSDVIRGLTDAWNAKEEINWAKSLNFILEIFGHNAFWELTYKGRHNFRNSFLRTVCELITAGTKFDKNAFEKNLIIIAEQILLRIDEKIDDEEGGFNDIGFQYLNSSYGKFYDALLNLSLRYARVNKESRQELWLPRIKAIFNKRLDRKLEKTINLSVCLGGFLSNFKFLDPSWVEDNINQIFPKDNILHWQAAMEGHLTFTLHYYKNNYLLLRENNHIKMAIDLGFGNQLNEKLCGYVILAYLDGVEILENKNSMISYLIDTGKYYYEIERFLWIDRENPKLNSKTVFPLWIYIYYKVSKDLKNPTNQKVLAGLTEWLYFFEEINDDLYEILKKSVNCLKKTYNTCFFIENLHRLKKTNIERVGNLFLMLLDVEDYPTYKEENIRSIVGELYIKKQKEIADEICIKYAERNLLFLRDIYEKFNREL